MCGYSVECLSILRKSASMFAGCWMLLFNVLSLSVSLLKRWSMRSYWLVVVLACVEQEVRTDSKILHHSYNSTLHRVMLPAGSKDDSYKLCVTVEGVDAFNAKASVTVTIRVGLLYSSHILTCSTYLLWNLSHFNHESWCFVERSLSYKTMHLMICKISKENKCQFLECSNVECNP